MSEKYVVVWSSPRFDTVCAGDAAEAARIVRGTLRRGDFLLGVYPISGPIPPEFDGFPAPPAQARAVA
jgi:hypothetical protein